jgi:hypothetical protein
VPRIFLTDSLTGVPPDQLVATLQMVLQQLEDQLNENVLVTSLAQTNGIFPQGIRYGDIVFDLLNGELKAGIFNGEGVTFVEFGSFTGAITDSQHGTRSGGSLHANATTSLAGFMSAADKIKLETYKGQTSAATPPTITEFPSNGDWGFHTDTSGPTYYLASNFSGTIKSVTLT